MLSEKLVAEWHPTLNGELQPEDVSGGSGKNIWWRCNKNPEHVWQAKPHNRSRWPGCPLCRKAPSLNDKLIVEWHPSKNLGLLPSDVTSMSSKKVWWLCKRNHSYEKEICHKARGIGCPHCPRDNPLGDDLVKQWHPTMNGLLLPTDVSRGSKRQIYWICDSSHVWRAPVSRRSQGHGCPICRTSKGEESIKLVLESLSVVYSREFPLRYKNGDRKKYLRFDFAVAVGQKRALIEFHGKQHYDAVDFWGGQKSLERTQRRDHLKRETCRKIGLPLLEIPYWDFKNIDVLVTEFIESL